MSLSGLSKYYGSSSISDELRYAIDNLESSYKYKTHTEVLQDQLTEKLAEITTLNERIKYLEEAILELEGK